jgi:hypothetical protein
MSDSLLDAKAVADRLMVPSAFLPRGDLATLGLAALRSTPCLAAARSSAVDPRRNGRVGEAPSQAEIADAEATGQAKARPGQIHTPCHGSRTSVLR